MQYKNEEADRGFKYVELEFKNVDSAHVMKSVTNGYFPEVLSAPDHRWVFWEPGLDDA